MLWSPWPSSVDLAPYGLELVGHPPLMVRPAGGELPPTPPELEIVEVADDAALRAYEATFIDGYPVPELQPAGSRRMLDPRILGGPLRLWIGSVGGEPVSVAASYRGEQAVSVFLVATLPQARGKGYGAALTARACQVDSGLPAELQASDDGRPVYLRMGFQIITPYDLWMAPR
jgi:GNAT superfamily N-acetyltransferase